MQVYNKQDLKERRKTLRKNQTPAERKLWNSLRNKKIQDFKFYRQFSIDYYIADFYCPESKLVIEIDGLQHNRKYEKDYDQVRTELLESLNIKVIRFSNDKVMNNFQEVIDQIKIELLNSPPTPLFTSRAGS
jgi:very-short-patch-repair endonuclease